jgi:phosphoglycerate dehydrogenase-like enzyme
MTTPITLGLIASDNALLPELFERHLPEGWRLRPAGTAYDETQKAMLAEADYLVMAGGALPREAIERATRLRMVQKMGVGYDGIDLDVMAARGIPLANCPVDSASLAVAEHAVALAVSSLKLIPFLDTAVRVEREWPRWEPRRKIRQIGTQTVGIIGFGRIGRHAARLFLGLGCTVVVQTRTRPTDAEQFASDLGAGAAARISFVQDLDAVFETATLVSLHVALTEGTTGLVGRRQLDLLGPRGLLVNTARGDVVDEPELIAALREGRLGAAALDVLSTEPAPRDLELLSLPNVIITPHCATGGTDVVEEKLLFALGNLMAFHEGREIQAVIVG